MNIVIRTDASKKIGTGHVTRCLTLAKKLRSLGAFCLFTCREHSGNLIEFIRRQEFEVITLPYENTESNLINEVEVQLLGHENWLGVDWATDAEETKIGISDLEVDWLIVDHYALDYRWEAKMRQQCKNIMVIDDIADRIHDCDFLLDQNQFHDMVERYQGKIPNHCKRILGPGYALLQPQYANLKPYVPPREGSISRIFIYFGGADNNNLTGMAVSSFLNLKRNDIKLDIVINSSSQYISKLKKQIAKNSNILLHIDLPDLALLMAHADLAIGACGATSWERCCMGLPTIVITLADNQKPIAKELDRLGLIRLIGDATEIDEPKLTKALQEACNAGLLQEWSERCYQTVDGLGAKRVCEILMLNEQTKVKARLAEVDDEKIIIKFTNDPVVMKNIKEVDLNKRIICRKFFRKQILNANNCQIYIIETEEKLSIGQVQFELINNCWMIDFYLDEVARNCGIDLNILESAINKFKENKKGILTFKEIKNRNIANHVNELDTLKKTVRKNKLNLSICSDVNSWINSFIPKLLLQWLNDGHTVTWVHSATELKGGDICFYLSYSKIVEKNIRKTFKNNLVVHESNLPQGRGWSPMTWQILEGESRIPVTLLEADDQVDAGQIYLQDWIVLTGYELYSEWRELQAIATNKLCEVFVSKYPSILNAGRIQEGEISYYKRRISNDSELDKNKTIAEQFNLLRVVDNEKYPAYINIKGEKYIIKIENENTNFKNDK